MAIRMGSAPSTSAWFWLAGDALGRRLPHTSRVSLRVQEVPAIPPRPTTIRIETFEFTIELHGVSFGNKLPGALKIARAADGLGLNVELHSCNPAHHHLMTALRNTNYYEMNLVHPTHDASTFNHYLGDYRDTLNTIDEDGCVYAPEVPGLGVAIDWDYINATRTDGKVFEQ